MIIYLCVHVSHRSKVLQLVVSELGCYISGIRVRVPQLVVSERGDGLIGVFSHV